MSKHRTFPVFSAAGVHSGTCGHQHSDVETAFNCIRHLAMRHRAVNRFEIQQFNENETSKVVEVLTRDPELCTECGRSLIKSAEHESGHRFDCPMVGGGD